MTTTNTDYSKKCEILNKFWTEYRDEEAFENFIYENDLGLPLAHLIYTGVVESTPLAKEFIEGTFDDFLEMLGLEDVGFDNLSDIL